MSDLYISNTPVSYREDLCLALGRAGFRIIFHQAGDWPTTSVCGKVFLKDVVSLLEKERPSRVIVPEFSGIAFQMLHYRKRFGFRLISLCDDSIDMIDGHDFTGLHRWTRRWMPKHLDGIIVLSPQVQDWFRNQFDIKSLWVPLIADERRVRPELDRVLSLAERIRPTDKPIVAYVGRFVDIKNIPALIRAFRPLENRAQLVLIGDGPQREALQAMAPGAVFTGMRSGDDLLAWYDLIDILVLPSTLEPYGAVTGEALMAGAKVVVSRRAGSLDLVREGENGYGVDPMDEVEMTDRIGRLLDGIPSGRPLRLRENQLPYRFEPCVQELIQEIKSL